MYTGLIYKGPSMLKDMQIELIDLLKKDGYSNIKQAVGADYKEK